MMQQDDARCSDRGHRDGGAMPFADPQWFAVHTKPHAEEHCVAMLARRDVLTFLPRILIRRRHGSKRWDALEPLFPGYLFARFALEPRVLSQVRWTPGVRRILGDEAPVPVPDDAVALLQDRMAGQGFIVPGPDFSSGMRVRFRSGPLARLEGLVVRVGSRAERVRVLLDLLHRTVSVDVDADVLERV